MLGKRKSSYSFLRVFIMMALILAACGSNTEFAPATATHEIEVTVTHPAVETSVPIDNGETLTLWVPPFLSPFQDTPEAMLLADQLSTYEEQNPGIQIIVRVKDDSGQAGLIEMLRAASIAAPATLPDVVVLNPSASITAASDNLIAPIDEVSQSPAPPEWYEHSIASVRFNNSSYGIPFASETDVFVYRETAFDSSPFGWADLLSGEETYLFPAGDQDATFTLAQYIALDGLLQDEQGKLSITTSILRDVLEFYSLSNQNGLLPLSSLQYVSSDQTWAVLKQLGVSSAVVPFGLFLSESSDDQFIAQPFPTSNGDGIILTKTYAWSIVAKEEERQALGFELIDWLMNPDFLGPWAHSLGMLPATSAALSHWPDERTKALVNQLVRVAIPLPDAETLAIVGPALQDSIEEVLFKRSTPNAAALRAAEQITSP